MDEFDPTQPFETVADAGVAEFDPSKPFDVVSSDPASKPIEGLGKEKTFLQQAEERAKEPQPEIPLGERLRRVTPEQQIKAAAVGLEESIPFPTTTLAAGLTSAYEGLMSGKPATTEDAARKYRELVQAKEQVKSEAPGYADIAGLALGSAIPLPTGAGSTAVKAAQTGADVAQSASGVLERGAQHAAVSATKASGKQLEKLNRVNPELGKFLLDEGIVKAGQNVEDLREAVRQARKIADSRLDDTYKNIDSLTQGKTVDVKDVIGHIEDTKNSLSRVHTNDELRGALDKEIKMLLDRYPDGFLSAKEAQEIKSAYQRLGYGRDVIPGAPSADVSRKLGDVYRDSLLFSVKKADPSLSSALAAENVKSSNLRAAESILSGKKVPDMSIAESVVGVAGSLAHPAGMAIPILSKQVRSRGASTLAAAERAGSRVTGAASDALSRLAASPELKPIVDAAVRAVGVDTVNSIVTQYGEDDPRTKALLMRLATKGE